ncbi:MAG: pilus assembly protein [Rhodospirillales bacterium]|nr:pilus assembly protein [Rhodospirillales bacterium]MDE2198049.1 pilus assembly protein [Rhodospirillales bacterium]MDE2575298.1 pilus assembly protein [Rhodospirillales bacterium]
MARPQVTPTRQDRPGKTRGLRARLAAWLGARRGASTLEFAVCFPIFLFGVFIVLENGYALFAQSLLDNATNDAARLIRTGQVQNAGGSSAAFRTRLCNDVGPVIPCSAITFNVQAAASFAALNSTVQTNGGKMASTSFTPGTPGQDVMVQVAYQRPYLIPYVGAVIGQANPGLMVATAAFQNELF